MESRGRSPAIDDDKDDKKPREKISKTRRSSSSSSSSSNARRKKVESIRIRRKKSKSPHRSERSKSPRRAERSKSPRPSVRSKSPRRSVKSKSPRRSVRSKSPRRSERSTSRDRRRKQRSSSPRRKERSSSPRRKERRRNRSPSPHSRRKSRRSSSSSSSSSSTKSQPRRDKETSAPRRSRFTDKPNPEMLPQQPLYAPPSIYMPQPALLGLGGGFGMNRGFGMGQPVVPQVNPTLAALLSGAMSSVTNIVPKEARELFIGNTPPGTADAVLLEFLNAAMRQVGLVSGPLDPIITCRMNAKFAFIECRTVEDTTNNTLNLDGIPFMGCMLKIGRPSKYSGPFTPSVTWQQLTGQSVDPAANTVDLSTKKFRELFVGNTSPEMTEVAMREFIGGAMHKMGLTFGPDNPILQVRLNGRFAFLEFRSMEETANCLNLNNIPFLGQPLKISRPSKYEGPQIPFYEWDDLLARWLTGELKLTTAGPVSCALKLSNMVNAATLADKTARDEVVEDTREECAGFGTVQRVIIPRQEDGMYAQKGVGKVYVEMSSEEEAKQALLALKGRTFDGRVVDVKFFPAGQLSSDPPDFTDPKPLVITALGPLPLESVVGQQMAAAVSGSTPAATTSSVSSVGGMGVDLMASISSMLHRPPPPTTTPPVISANDGYATTAPIQSGEHDFDSLDEGNYLSMSKR